MGRGVRRPMAGGGGGEGLVPVVILMLRASAGCGRSRVSGAKAVVAVVDTAAVAVVRLTAKAWCR